jgi:hypothetical protein
MNDCKSCRKAGANPGVKKSTGWLMGFLLVILPKCPFCILAYTSTLMLCGKDSITTKTSIHYSQTTLLITSVLCLLTLFSILMNYRDTRTKYALGLVLAGSSMAILSAFQTGGEYLYYMGVMVIFTGVWTNGSMLYFVRKYRNRKNSPAF